MSKYTIDWSERKTTSTGKNKLDATLKDDSGKLHDKVTIWSDFPNFDNLMTGHDVDGDIVEKQNGQYLNKTLYATKTYSGHLPKNQRLPNSGAKEGLNRKIASINASQDHKDNSIKISSTFRDATIITAEQMKSSDIDWKVLWKENRQWLWENFDVSNGDYPPFQG